LASAKEDHEDGRIDRLITSILVIAKGVGSLN
jgi:hypothetical protein